MERSRTLRLRCQCKQKFNLSGQRTSKQAFEFVWSDFGVAQYALQQLRMQDFLGMERNRHTIPDNVLVDLVAAALPCQLKSLLFKHRDNFACSNPWQLRHQTETSTVDRLKDFGSASSSWSACRSSRCSRIASLMLLKASS